MRDSTRDFGGAVIYRLVSGEFELPSVELGGSVALWEPLDGYGGYEVHWSAITLGSHEWIWPLATSDDTYAYCNQVRILDAPAGNQTFDRFEFCPWVDVADDPDEPTMPNHVFMGPGMLRYPMDTWETEGLPLAFPWDPASGSPGNVLTTHVTARRHGSKWWVGECRFSVDILYAEAIVTPHPEDVTEDCVVDINDLLAVIAAWG